MATKTKTTAKRKRAPVRRRTPKKAAPRTRGMLPSECKLDELPPAAAEVAARVEREGGLVHRQLPRAARRQSAAARRAADRPRRADAVPARPLRRAPQEARRRDRQDRAASSIRSSRSPRRRKASGRRTAATASRRCAGSARSRSSRWSCPKREIAWQILALNTEKAHNLRERSLEVIRIYKGLLEEDDAPPESDFAFYLEEAALVTLGLCYEKKGNFAGGAYHPILRRLEAFSDEPLAKALTVHEQHAEQVFELDEQVTAVVAKLQGARPVSPYLRTFVVARINPLRWIKDEPPPLDEVLKTMRERRRGSTSRRSSRRTWRRWAERGGSRGSGSAHGSGTKPFGNGSGRRSAYQAAAAAATRPARPGSCASRSRSRSFRPASTKRGGNPRTARARLRDGRDPCRASARWSLRAGLAARIALRVSVGCALRARFRRRPTGRGRDLPARAAARLVVRPMFAKQRDADHADVVRPTRARGVGIGEAREVERGDLVEILAPALDPHRVPGPST